jgi:putative endonuclease
MLGCRNGVIYTGITNDIGKRFKSHLKGSGGSYTHRNRPNRILYKELFESRLKAEKREQQIKRWSKSKKLALIKGDKEMLANLSKSRD